MENMVGDISVHPAVGLPQNTLLHLGITQVPTDHPLVERVHIVFRDCSQKRWDKHSVAERHPHVSLPPGIGQNPVLRLHPVAVRGGNDVPDLYILQSTGVQ